MSSRTNLTDRISHLCFRRGGSKIAVGRQSTNRLPSRLIKTNRERRFAADIFMCFAYTLLGMALCCQLILIVWLDII